MFIALHTNIFGRITTSNQQKILIFKLIGSSKIVGMNYGTWEVFNSLEIGHIWRGEMSRSYYQIIELFDVGLVNFKIVEYQSKFLGVFIIIYPASGGVEPYKISCFTLFNSALDVVEKYRAGRVGGNRFFEMFVEGVIGEF